MNDPERDKLLRLLRDARVGLAGLLHGGAAFVGGIRVHELAAEIDATLDQYLPPQSGTVD
jgi:hypothetical protein